MKITGAARLAGIMGWPVAHSRSPLLHGFWLAETRVDGAYVPLAVRPGDIEPALRALPVLGFRGCNLTIPHKQTALRAVDRVDPFARRIGAVNTIVVAADGSLDASNTDIFGFRENLRDCAPDWSPSAGPAVVLGAGGSSRAVVAALGDMGVGEIRIVNRTRSRAEAVANDLANSTTLISVHSWNAASDVLDGAGLLVNTTSLGMTGEPHARSRLVAAAVVVAGRRYRLCAARDPVARRCTAARPSGRRRPRHAAAPGPARL